MKKQAEALNSMWWITPNEKRDIQQFEELDDPAMDQILVDSNKMLLSEMGAIPNVNVPGE